MLARLGGQGRVAVGALLGAAVAALCCFGVVATPSGDAAHATEAAPQALRGASAAGTQLSSTRRLPGVAAAAVAPTTTTTVSPPPPSTTTTTRPPTTTTTTTPPPRTTTTPPPTTTTPAPTLPTTFPPHHHCHHRACSFPG